MLAAYHQALGNGWLTPQSGAQEVVLWFNVCASNPKACPQELAKQFGQAEQGVGFGGWEVDRDLFIAGDQFAADGGGASFEFVGEGRGIQVYRGTDITSELLIHDETGLLMSDAARRGYEESGGSVDAARAASQTAHQAGIETWGSETDYAQARAAFGREMTGFGQRSMISVTTNVEQAKYFARDGKVFTAFIDPEGMIPQTLEGAGEDEYIVEGMIEAVPWVP
jgi:hypothetical protein